MFHYLIIMNVEMKRKLVYGCLLIMVAVGMMSFSYDMTGEQEAKVQEEREKLEKYTQMLKQVQERMEGLKK